MFLWEIVPTRCQRPKFIVQEGHLTLTLDLQDLRCPVSTGHFSMRVSQWPFLLHFEKRMPIADSSLITGNPETIAGLVPGNGAGFAHRVASFQRNAGRLTVPIRPLSRLTFGRPVTRGFGRDLRHFHATPATMKILRNRNGTPPASDFGYRGDSRDLYSSRKSRR